MSVHDTIRITIPVAVHKSGEGDLALRKAVASWLTKRAAARGVRWEVTQRIDTGVVIIAPFERPTGGNAIASTAGVLGELERILEGAGAGSTVRALWDGIPYLTVKTNGG